MSIMRLTYRKAVRGLSREEREGLKKKKNERSRCVLQNILITGLRATVGYGGAEIHPLPEPPNHAKLSQDQLQRTI